MALPEPPLPFAVIRALRPLLYREGSGRLRAASTTGGAAAPGTLKRGATMSCYAARALV